MKILVCIKQVPDTTDIKWTENNTIQREGVESITNPFDVYAINEAVKIKQSHQAEITALTMGPNQAEAVLRYAISVGCDNGVLLSDKKFSGADTYATGKTISTAIKSKLSDFDLIICGQYAIDGDTAQTGPSIAQKLNIPQITYVKTIKEINDKYITVIRETDEGLETIQAELPVLICVIKGEYEPPRPLINGIIKAQKAMITTYNTDDIGLPPEEAGLKGSPTYVSKAFRPVHKRGECEFTKDYEKLAEKIKEFGGINE